MKASRFLRASRRKPRKLSGWNVFLRQSMEGIVSTTEEYSQKMKQLSEEWRQLPFDDKIAFEVEAQQQETLRSKLAFTPLSVGDAARTPTELEKQVGRAGCKHLSARRLTINEKLFQQDSVWSLPTCFCDRHLPHRAWEVFLLALSTLTCCM